MAMWGVTFWSLSLSTNSSASKPMPVAAARPGAAIAKIARCILGARQKVDHPADCGHSSRADCAWFLNCDGVILRALTKARVKEGTEL